MGELQRVQVILNRTQRKALTRIAKREGRSMSAVLRDVIERGLAARARDEERWKVAMADLAEIRKRSATRGINFDNIINEVRAERERQLESIWRS